MQPATRSCRIKAPSSNMHIRRHNNPPLWVLNWWQWPTTTPSAPTCTHSHTTASPWWGNNRRTWTCTLSRFRNSSALDSPEVTWINNTITSSTETILTRTQASASRPAWSKRSRLAPTPTSTVNMELSTTTAVIIPTLSWPSCNRTSSISSKTTNSSNSRCTASSSRKCRTSPSTWDSQIITRIKTLPTRSLTT
jgi:hypothetical protein